MFDVGERPIRADTAGVKGRCQSTENPLKNPHFF